MKGLCESRALFFRLNKESAFQGETIIFAVQKMADITN
ncbi:hypothetical protein NC99_20040 [Sunxiuqinia dokdonensis]|uniref:Uncharacterized protein n=1 Tax=Sunxiuqinia dokdonensis TaxID=1409788 RepID=A0A0L8VAF2_9BACT|nr:hypothetical protein NC99_20040 [Sunxiuqinia dokdonensis]